MRWSGRGRFSSLWRSAPGADPALRLAVDPFLLALESLYRRQTLRMPLREALKILFGFTFPFLLVNHVIGTRIEWVLTGCNDSRHLAEDVGRSRLRDPAIGDTGARLVPWLPRPGSGCAPATGIRATRRFSIPSRCWCRFWRFSASPPAPARCRRPPTSCSSRRAAAMPKR